ncbi:hypothetical protein [Desulfovibrio sp. ZJ200]|uniref:hypothetical protein n=1 Tax=Desulfovibrio sp. ZJ200 TaxID=2709792 RepID=UPI0013ECCF1E|nr:hypothetical protein [Desulfovibrio sp. ZJ200]
MAMKVLVQKGTAWFVCSVCFCLLVACKATVPTLDPMKAQAPVSTTYTTALNDLNTVLEVYLPPDYPYTYYYVKPVTDATGLSATGEIPMDITAMVRDAISQVSYKVRHIERYDLSDAQHLAVELQKLQMMKITRGDIKISERPDPDFTIAGRIAQFDRNLESQSDKARAMANFAEGLSRTDISGSAENSSRLSRLAISFSVYNTNGISLPGKYGASMEVQYAKNGVDIGFAIFGNGLGFGSEATAMHGRHLALQMMTEFSVVQIIGRSLNIPYWRVGEGHKIFTPDRLVLNEWSTQYASMGPLLIPFMQSQLIACGDSSVVVTGHLDEQTRAALDRFADKFGVRNRVYPNFEMFKALESNRLLDRGTASMAWSAYNAYKGGARPSAPAASAPAASAPTSRPSPSAPPAAAPARQPKATPARPAAPAPDVTRPLEDLL